MYEPARKAGQGGIRIAITRASFYFTKGILKYL